MGKLTGVLVDKHASDCRTSSIWRRSGAATFRIRILQLGGSTAGALIASIEHRNEIEDSWTLAGTFPGILTTGIVTKRLTELRQLVRIRVNVSGGSSNAWARLSIFDPAWEPPMTDGSREP